MSRMAAEAFRHSQLVMKVLGPGPIATYSNPAAVSVAAASKPVLEPMYAVPAGADWLAYVMGTLGAIAGVVPIDMGEIGGADAYSRLDISATSVDAAPNNKTCQEDIYGFRRFETFNGDGAMIEAVVVEKLFSGLGYTFGTKTHYAGYTPQAEGVLQTLAKSVVDPTGAGVAIGRYAAATGGVMDIQPFPTPGLSQEIAGYTLYDRGPWRGFIRCMAVGASNPVAGFYPTHSRWR